MKTSKAFSTISYNTDGYLNATLNKLVSARKIDFYAYIEHSPEEDEKKKHKHLYIVPNGKIDTDQVRNELIEIDPKTPMLPPLGCMPAKSSKFGDWYLYTKHDKAYLASKGQSRKYHYQIDDFVVSDFDYFKEEINTIDLTKYTRFSELIKAVEDGKSFSEFLKSGIVPIQQTYAYEKAFQIIRSTVLSRNERTTHTPKIYPDTGEVIEPVATEMTESQRAPESSRVAPGEPWKAPGEPWRAQESRKPLYNKPDKTPRANEPQRAQESPGEPKAWYERYEEYEPEGEELPY